VVSTLAYFGLYTLFRDLAPALVANVAALLITALGNTAANRRFTFGVRGRRALARDHTGGLIALLIALAITTASLTALRVLAADPGRLAELVVLGGANLVATVTRFVLLRAWIYHPRAPAGGLRLGST
jgi:putative flippase GtrA